MRFVALIPARAGSKRCPGKNTRFLNGKPLIAYTIEAAVQSQCFDQIIVATDDETAKAHGAAMGCKIFWRDHVPDGQADIEWVREVLKTVECSAFAILRPTSPFRTAETIKRAVAQFKREEVHSLRAVEPVKQHPGKMWWNNGPGYPMTPVCDAKRSDGTPWHSCPTQTLPHAYVQNASLEIAWKYVVESFGTITGRKIGPFLTEGLEGFDINTELDFELAKHHAFDVFTLGKYEEAFIAASDREVRADENRS